MALAQKAGTTVKGVYRFDMSTRTKSANAALMGLGATRRIVLGDTLLDEFTAEEIESVLAHELGHQVHRDIPIGIAFNTVFTLLSFWLANAALTWGIGVFGLSGIADPAGLPLFGIVM
jgi:STE24 endopeptidase